MKKYKVSLQKEFFYLGLVLLVAFLEACFRNQTHILQLTRPISFILPTIVVLSVVATKKGIYLGVLNSTNLLIKRFWYKKLIPINKIYAIVTKKSSWQNSIIIYSEDNEPLTVSPSSKDLILSELKAINPNIELK